MDRIQAIKTRATSGLEEYMDKHKDALSAYAAYIWQSDRDTLWLIAQIERLEAELTTAVELLGGHCFSCKFVNDCAKHDNNGVGVSAWYCGDCDDWELGVQDE